MHHRHLQVQTARRHESFHDRSRWEANLWRPIMNDFTGKNVLVLGGSRGIGAAIVRRFIEGEASVAFTYAGSESAAQAVAQETGAQAIKANSADRDALMSSQVPMVQSSQAQCTPSTAASERKTDAIIATEAAIETFHQPLPPQKPPLRRQQSPTKRTLRWRRRCFKTGPSFTRAESP